jgi:hypothetical protein
MKTPLTYGELLAQLQALDLPADALVTLARFPYPLGIVQVGQAEGKVITEDGCIVDDDPYCCLVDSDEHVELRDGQVIAR